MAIGILEVKLGRPLEMPQRRFDLLLQACRRACCQVRNAGITHWVLWREQHPDWKPGDPYEGPKRLIKRGPAKPAKEGAAPPRDPPFAPREFLSRELYQFCTRRVPMLSTTVASSCVQEVSARLRSATPYNHDGAARYVWQAILSSEVSVPSWRMGRIPLPRSGLELTYTDDRCEMRMPLLSKKSGYRVIRPGVRLHCGDLSAGNRLVLRKLATGELRLADSQLIEKKGKWFAQLVYDVPTRSCGASPRDTLTIGPAQQDDNRPFVATWNTADGGEKRWYLGDGKPLVADYRRVVARRRALRARYSAGCGSGHGRKRWYRTIKPLSRYVTDMQGRFIKQLVSDIVKLAIRERCGKIVYRDPTQPVKDNSWFTTRDRDVPMNWCGLAERLAFRAEVAGLEYEETKIGMAEWRPKSDVG